MTTNEMIKVIKMQIISCNSHFKNEIEAFTHCLDLLQAEQEGRLVKLPCKEDDVLYEIQQDGTIQKWFADRIVKNSGQCWCVIAKDVKNKWRYVDKCFMFSSFGKKVFLTKKEAQKAKE